jgi:squalene-hopene/tetraprenyl-beta-curcumene cyclase
MIHANNRTRSGGLVCLVILALATVALAGETVSPDPQPIAVGPASDISLAKEVEHAIDRGLAFLLTSQNEAGWWSTADHPALTGLVLSAFLGHPNDRHRTNPSPAIGKGLRFIVDSAKPDGRIYRTSLANYNTAISAMVLYLSADPAYTPIVERARRFLIRSQVDTGKQGALDSPFDGGVGYNDKYEHSDLNNTLMALETLYYTRPKGAEDADDLDWTAAIHFIQHCQNLTSHNDQPWASDDSENKGGFVYLPGESKAGEMKLASGRTALRSYGSMSYAGLLSYVYADLDRDDPRVTAVYDWLQRNYTLDENPGLGSEGLYFYYHTMAKALATYGVDELSLASGEKINWRKDLALRLLNLQKTEGQWVNDNGRWWERDPILVTSYAVIALEVLHRGL